MVLAAPPGDPLCIFPDDVIDLLPDTYNAKAPMQQSTIARGATAFAKAQTVGGTGDGGALRWRSSRSRAPTFRRVKDER